MIECIICNKEIENVEKYNEHLFEHLTNLNHLIEQLNYMRRLI